MTGAYAVALLFSIAGLAVIDWRYKLVFFNNSKRAWHVLSLAIVFFVVWDIAGIALDIFFIGSTDHLLGFRIGEFPVEELGFLFLLNYNSLLLYRGYRVWSQRR